MAEHGKTLFSKRVPGGVGRSYFIDVKQSEKNGSRYLVVSESRNIDGSWKSNRVLVFPDHAGEWKQGLDEAYHLLTNP